MKIGQRVKVRRLKDNVSGEVVSKIKQNPFGVIEEYKMVDGSGVGAFVRLDSGFCTWFFEDELEPA